MEQGRDLVQPEVFSSQQLQEKETISVYYFIQLIFFQINLPAQKTSSYTIWDCHPVWSRITSQSRLKLSNSVIQSFMSFQRLKVKEVGCQLWARPTFFNLATSCWEMQSEKFSPFKITSTSIFRNVSTFDLTTILFFNYSNQLYLQFASIQVYKWL